MKATELRIGNWIQSSSNKKYQINLSWYECCKDSTEGRDIQLDTFPIPLTEEWLIKFGFKKENNTIYSISDKLSFNEVGRWHFFKNENNSFTPHIKRENKFSWIGKEIKHVHQLQNLYFALTGEELTIK